MKQTMLSSVIRGLLDGGRPSHISKEDVRSNGTSCAEPPDAACLLGQPAAASHAKQAVEALPAPAVTPASLPPAAATPASRSGTPGEGSGTPASLGQPSTKRKLPLVSPPLSATLPEGCDSAGRLCSLWLQRR